MTMTTPLHTHFASLTINLTILSGRNLVAKDKSFFTDPYVEVRIPQSIDHTIYGRTPVEYKTLNPHWNHSFCIQLGYLIQRQLMNSKSPKQIQLLIFDKDKLTKDDFMGVVPLSLLHDTTCSGPPQWHPVNQTYITRQNRRYYCERASGELEIKLEVMGRKFPMLMQGNVVPLIIVRQKLRVGIEWEIGHNQSLGNDLDMACVAVDQTGKVCVNESVFYGKTRNGNQSLVLLEDVRCGSTSKTSIITGDSNKHEKVIQINLNHIPQKVLALYFVLTVFTHGKTLQDMESACICVTVCEDGDDGMGVWELVPKFLEGKGGETVMFLMRIARDKIDGREWNIRVIEEMVSNARDFGTLIPELKGYTRDLIPNISIDPNKRIAIMRKGATIYLEDYFSRKYRSTRAHATTSDRIAFGLAWDVTNGFNIDLDASAICLDSQYRQVDMVCYSQLVSKDGAIKHSGDEREGDEVGDDETIRFTLAKIDPAIRYIGIVINSFSGHHLDNVAKASCRLYDLSSGDDMAMHHLTHNRELEKKTGLLMACLYKEVTHKWALRILSQPCMGRVASEVVGTLVTYLQTSPVQPPMPVPEEMDIIVTAMPCIVPRKEDIVFGPM